MIGSVFVIQTYKFEPRPWLFPCNLRFLAPSFFSKSRIKKLWMFTCVLWTPFHPLLRQRLRFSRRWWVPWGLMRESGWKNRLSLFSICKPDGCPLHRSRASHRLQGSYSPSSWFHWNDKFLSWNYIRKSNIFWVKVNTYEEKSACFFSDIQNSNACILSLGAIH